MSDRIMLDSTNPAAVLAAVKHGQTFHAGLKATLAAGYLDGLYKWPATAWGELAAAGISTHEQVAITVTGPGGEAFGKRGMVADEEPGDLDPAAAAAWAKSEREAHHWPVVYCNRSTKAAVIADCKHLGLDPATDYGLWVATLDGSLNDADGKPLRDQTGVVAIQYGQAHSPIAKAGTPPDLDVSLVVSTAWRAAKPPAAEKHEYIVVRLPDGSSSKMLSGMTLR